MRKKVSLLSLVLSISFSYLKAQQEKIILKAGESVQAFKMEHVYRYPVFISSKVVYKDGVTTTEKLNYNQITEKMEFIDPKGDTLVVTGDNDIKSVTLDKSVFYYNQGYFELIRETPSLNLARKITLKLVDRQKIGAFGQRSSTTAIETYNTNPNNAFSTRLQLNVDYIFSKTTTYYFTDNNIDFIPASQKNLLKLVAGKSEAINNYLNTSKTDFKNGEQLQDLMDYIQRL